MAANIVCAGSNPIFRCVETPNEYKCSDANNINIDEVYVTFNIAVKYEGYNNSYPNMLQVTYTTGSVYPVQLSTKNFKDAKPLFKNHFTK